MVSTGGHAGVTSASWDAPGLAGYKHPGGCVARHFAHAPWQVDASGAVPVHRLFLSKGGGATAGALALKLVASLCSTAQPSPAHVKRFRITVADAFVVPLDAAAVADVELLQP